MAAFLISRFFVMYSEDMQAILDGFNYEEKINNMNLKTGLLSLLFILLGVGVNIFREPLFGIVEGYAPHNLTFSTYVLLPMLLISFILGGFALIREVFYLNKTNYEGMKWQNYITLLVSLPGFLFGIVGLIFIFIFLSS